MLLDVLWKAVMVKSSVHHDRPTLQNVWLRQDTVLKGDKEDTTQNTSCLRSQEERAGTEASSIHTQLE